MPHSIFMLNYVFAILPILQNRMMSVRLPVLWDIKNRWIIQLSILVKFFFMGNGEVLITYMGGNAIFLEENFILSLNNKPLRFGVAKYLINDFSFDWNFLNRVFISRYFWGTPFCECQLIKLRSVAQTPLIIQLN